MLIRREVNRDHDAVYRLIQTAFASVDHRDGKEQDLVVALRRSESFVPQLSLVAEVEGAVVGHILFTEVRIGDAVALALAPLSVSPQHQRRGIGLALMAEGHRIAASLGYPVSVVLGSPDYYPKAGYREAAGYGIRAPFEVESRFFMARPLAMEMSGLDGVVVYDPAFFAG